MRLLYHFIHDRQEAEAISKLGFTDKPLYDSESSAKAAGQSPCGVALVDDPILLYEHCGSDVLRVEINCSEEELLPFEDLKNPGVTSHVPEALEDAWLRTGIPVVGTTYREWVIPVEWLRPRVVSLRFFEGHPDDLWREVARSRREARPREELARMIHEGA